MAVLALAFLSDMLDGLAARLTGQVTPFGARLDTWADLATYLTIGFGSWWLWSDIVHREDFYLYGIIACYLIPASVGMIKFGAYPSYHTWGVKVAAVCIGASLHPLFLADIAWPLRVLVYIYGVRLKYNVSDGLVPDPHLNNLIPKLLPSICSLN